MIIYIVEHWEIINMCDTQLMDYTIYKTIDEAKRDNLSLATNESELIRTLEKNGVGKILVTKEL